MGNPSRIAVVRCLSRGGRYTRHVLDRVDNKYQLLPMNPRDALHHGKRAANKGGRSV